MHKKIITIICISSTFATLVNANPLVETEATPSVMSELGARLLITEINFNNGEKDWVKIKYTSPNNTPINLKGIGFADDSTFKTIENDFIIASGQDILLTFKEEISDNAPYLYSKRTGLTATTEQFIIYDKNKNVLDAICWASSSPTESEIKDLIDLYEKEGWHSNDILSCVSSDNIEKNVSLTRVGETDTNSKIDWRFPSDQSVNTQALTETSILTPDLVEISNPATNIAFTSESKTATAASADYEVATASNSVASSFNTPIPLISPDLVEINTPQITEKEKTSASAKKTTSKTKSSSSAYLNGDASDQIIINEILPNPDKTDTDNEWIELYNSGDTDTNLGNWILDDIEGGSKPYIIPDDIVIKSDSTVLIESKISKISLGNAQDAIRLFDFNETLIGEIPYEEAPSGQSYSRIVIINEDETESVEWIWTKDQTPNQNNPIYLQISADITDEPAFTETYFFSVNDIKGESLKIEFDEELIAAPLAKATFIKNTKISLTLEETDEANTYKLIKYTVISGPPKTVGFQNYLIPSIIFSILFIGGISFYLLHKKMPWLEGDSNKTETQKKL